MTRTTKWALSVGVLLFVAVVISQGLPAIISSLALAGWGLVPVALFHWLPLVLDAGAMRVLFDGPSSAGLGFLDAVKARWAGESANSLLPAGQLGGPVMMVRYLVKLGMPLPQAAAAITVSMTLQTFGQIAFAMLGLALLRAHNVRTAALIASAVLSIQIVIFYLLQRRGLFSKVVRTLSRFSGKRDWTLLAIDAAAIDAAVLRTYEQSGAVALSFGLGLVGWLVGTGEVYFILYLLRAPVDWTDALVLESLGQAIRGAAFAIPGALGVQEGGYLLVGSFCGLSPETALALSLAKRAREILLGVPGLLLLREQRGR